MGDTQLPRMRNAALSIDTSQASAGANTQRVSLKLDVRDVVRREGYRTDLNTRIQRDEFRGNAREEQRMQRRDAFWSHVNKGVAYSWVSDRGLVVSDEEMELAFKFYRGGEGIGWLAEANVLAKLAGVPNAPSQEDFAALSLFDRDGISWEDLKKLLDTNELGDFDPVKEAFALLDETRSGVLSREQVKEMAENWGIGEITEEDVDDLFRATGVDPVTQPSITLSEYRDLVRIDLSNQEGVRVKLVDQLSQQPMVIIGQDPRTTHFAMQSPLAGRGTPSSPSRTPTRPFSARATSAPATPVQFPGLHPDSPTRSPASPVFPLHTNSRRPGSPARPPSARPASPLRPASPMATRGPALPSSPTRSPSPPRLMRPPSPQPKAAAPKKTPSPSLAQPVTTRKRSATLPAKLSPPRGSTQSSKSTKIDPKHNVGFAEFDDESLPTTESTKAPMKSATSEKFNRLASTGSMKLNLALFKAEELLTKAEHKPSIPAITSSHSPSKKSDAQTKNFELQKKPKLKDMYSSSKDIDKLYMTKK